MEVTVRTAQTEEDRQAVFRLRYEIYHEEMNYTTAGLDHEDRTMSDPHDDAAHIYLAEDEDGRIVGTLRITWGGDGPFSEDHEEAYSPSMFAEAARLDEVVILTRFMVPEELRGSMVPVALFEAAGWFSREHGVSVCVCDAQPHLLNLYTGLGFRTFRSTYNDPMIGLMVPLVLLVDDVDHLRRIGSPILAFESYLGHEAEPPADLIALLPSAATVQPVGRDAVALLASRFGDAARPTERTGVLEGLDEGALAMVMDRGFEIACVRGDHVVQQRNIDRTMFLVADGTLEVRDGVHVVAVLTAGDVVGELALLLHAERLTDVVVVSETARVISLNEKAILRLTEEAPAVAAQLWRNVATAVGQKLVGLHQQWQTTASRGRSAAAEP